MSSSSGVAGSAAHGLNWLLPFGIGEYQSHRTFALTLEPTELAELAAPPRVGCLDCVWRRKESRISWSDKSPKCSRRFGSRQSFKVSDWRQRVPSILPAAGKVAGIYWNSISHSTIKSRLASPISSGEQPSPTF